MVMEQHKRNGIARWTAIEKSTGKYMGWSGIKLYEKECCGHINFYEIGYRFKPEYWGKGFATETAKAALDYTFNTLKAEVACAMTHHENLASKSVLEKNGFVKTQEFMEGDIPCFFFECKRP
jgi:RimJ/RimL family protein N-acetyltransferase